MLALAFIVARDGLAALSRDPIAWLAGLTERREQLGDARFRRELAVFGARGHAVNPSLTIADAITES
ncbi:MAG: hypothetical protein JO107_00105 [Hyphomicrobiales bacterium]|nr:hypothetical protein [Hyphomicrobiales bacterium]